MAFQLHFQDFTHEDLSQNEVQHWMLLLHGILGTGKNWQGFAKSIVAQNPKWGVTTVDLRMHGLSQGAPEPHSVIACAHDLRLLEDQLNRHFTAISGHSFGSKVATHFVHQKLLEGNANSPEALWILDADPGARPDRLAAEKQAQESVFAILDQLASLPTKFAHRQEFQQQMLAFGHSNSLVGWLAMNLEKVENHYQLRIDVLKIRELLSDYLKQDCWPLLERIAEDVTVDVILGGKSTSVSEEAKAKLKEWDAEAILALHLLEDSGHWVHIDSPTDLLAVVLRTLPD